MKIQLLSILFIGIIVQISCKKEEPPVVDPLYDSYSNLKVGNYWNYRRYGFYNGIYTPLDQFDSTYVEKDTFINSRTFFKVVNVVHVSSNHSYNEVSYLRDSLHYTVNHGGRIVFSSVNFTDTLHSGYFILPQDHQAPGDTLASLFAMMANDNVSVTVPAGTFTTKNYRTTYVLQGFSSNGQLRFWDRLYAKDVGLVEESQPYISAPDAAVVRRLIRYGSN